jgi:isopentenyl-diphosphate delta-isomerase type 1
MKEEVILVDEHDRPIGVAEKLLAHREGKLHRAFSVFILRKNGSAWQVLLQQRQQDKYHCGGLWSNTCCSHPMPKETILAAATRRLQQEMGFCVALNAAGTFIYKAEFANGLIEYELDHVLFGYTQRDEFEVNVEEVMDYRWMDLKQFEQNLANQPALYTPWLATALAMLKFT